jgi:hypothetical protein
MLNENSTKGSITLFLDYLMNNSKKSKNDVKGYLPQAYHVFAVLYLFFTGKESST